MEKNSGKISIKQQLQETFRKQNSSKKIYKKTLGKKRKKTKTLEKT